MGEVIDLQSYRERRRVGGLPPLERIRLAMERFGPVIRRLRGPALSAAERDLAGIKRLVDRGRMAEGAERAEALAWSLERAGA